MHFKYKQMMGYALFKDLSEAGQIQNLSNQISMNSAIQFLNAVLHNQVPRISVTINSKTGEIVDGYKRLSALAMLFLSNEEMPFGVYIRYNEYKDTFGYAGYKPNRVYNVLGVSEICDEIKKDTSIPMDVNINEYISNLRHCNTVFQNLIIDVCYATFESEEEKQILRENINGKLTK